MKHLIALIVAACLLLPVQAADISITAASVVKVNGSQSIGTAGASITAGSPLYIDSSGNLQLAKADTLIHSGCVGIALNAASTGQPVFYQTGGLITYNSAFTQGIIYCVAADNAGAIAPFTDLTTGNYVTILGVATSATQLQLQINPTGVHQ